MTTIQCASCGAAAPPGSSACSYCGSVLAQNIRVAGDREASSAEQALDLLMSNIESLRNFPRPENGLITILRIYVTVITMGISLIFWRRPKHRFRIDEFRKLRGIIETNIALLRARHVQDGIVSEQIDVIEGEFEKTESFFTRQITTRRVIFAATGIAVLWLAITGDSQKRGASDEIAAYLPSGETYVAHGKYANLPYLALVTKTAGGFQRIYIVNRAGGETHRVIGEEGGVLEERNITQVRAKNDGSFEYSKQENRGRTYHTVIWNEAKKSFVKSSR